MTTLTVTIRNRTTGALLDVTEVRLSDPTGVYGLRTGTDGTILVADNTLMTRVDTGTYSYEVALPASTRPVAYHWCAEVLYGGERYHIARVHTEPATIAASPAYSARDRAEAEVLMAEWGVAVTVYDSPADLTGRACTGIVCYGQRTTDGPTRILKPFLTLELYNHATEGLHVDGYTGTQEVGIPKSEGSAETVRRRLVRQIPGGNSALSKWEL